MAEVNPPVWMGGVCYSAERDRGLLRALICSEGVHDSGALLADLPGGMTVRVGTGSAFVQGDHSTLQGMYFVTAVGTTSLAVAAASPSNPRIDLVVAQIQDDPYDSSGQRRWRLYVVTGNPSAVPVAPATPLSALPLWQVSVPAGAGAPSGLTDVRPRAGLCDSLGQASGSQVQRTTAGVWSPSIPSWATVARVRLWGAGGGGGGSASTSATEASAGGGGGSGAYVEGYVSVEDLAANTLTVGAGGAGGIGAAASGSAGGTSSLGSLLQAQGGFGGASIGAVNGVIGVIGGSGGSALAGPTRMSGESGHPAQLFPIPWGATTWVQVTRTARGGAAPAGGRPGIPVANGNGNGSAGEPFGGGGAGAVSSGASGAYNGGAGGNGGAVIDFLG